MPEILLFVAPLVGAWIEIVTQKCINCEKIVAPLVGAWIEIIKAMSSLGAPPSLLSWERGLKSIRSAAQV